METLNALAESEAGSFDFAFIDADKTNYINYYEVCLKVRQQPCIMTITKVPDYEDKNFLLL